MLIARGKIKSFFVLLVCFVFVSNYIECNTGQTQKYCMHCKGIKTTLTPEGTPYACKYCNGTGILKSSESNIIK